MRDGIKIIEKKEKCLSSSLVLSKFQFEISSLLLLSRVYNYNRKIIHGNQKLNNIENLDIDMWVNVNNIITV